VEDGSDEYSRRKYFELLLQIENYENSRLNSSRPCQGTIKIRSEYNNIKKKKCHPLTETMVEAISTHYRQDNPANGTSLFPDNVGCPQYCS